MGKLSLRWKRVLETHVPYGAVFGLYSFHKFIYLLAAHELTPGISAAEYRERRQRLAALLPPGGVAILPAAGVSYMSGAIPWPYRQDPDFMYLTGINQRGVALITAAQSGRPEEHRYTLFIDPPNTTRDRWDGASLTRDAALPRRLHAQAANPSGPPLLHDPDRPGAHHGHHIAAALRPASQQPGRLAPLRPLLHSMRLVKSKAEAALMQTSAALASSAVAHCMAASAPGVTEYGIAAAFEYGVKAGGAQRLAYPSVVAGGPDACTTHYSRADKVLRAGQLVLMDAGCEYWGYVSDVTRTWPVGGRFSGPQRDVYELVLEVHQRCLATCRPGSSIRELHALSCEMLSDGIRQLRLLPGASAEEIRRNGYREFFWHSLGHYLGMDTHDTSLVGYDRKLEAGNVITVEPGLYIPDLPQFGPYRGIGVRIEDDVLLTVQGCAVLSDQAPVAVSAVEELVGSALAAGATPRLPLPPRLEVAAHRRLAEPPPPYADHGSAVPIVAPPPPPAESEAPSRAAAFAASAPASAAAAAT
ncbi:hypothetical protein GPECTOR_3g245 [Gonium pectorale]|uniref:Aminopeptidase P N-terminal domain-containing protein n=1 Tax=Gonium pectorale TaxID=33097 RepID=A0A150H0K3_GONPE|nr:hypothetical protein GPECTOR_3g245 [Gonium pectorale]|eukprot:KXZ55090.1 hypothetical protein GPECTOR_3g245 [Gonium pectorale]